MKPTFVKIISAVILFSASSVCAAENTQDFKVLILGTRHFSDVDVITKNIRSMKNVKRYIPSVSNQKHLEFTGTLEGDNDTFIEDIKSLSLDRFDVSVKDSQSRGLVITLRKMR